MHIIKMNNNDDDDLKDFSNDLRKDYFFLKSR